MLSKQGWHFIRAGRQHAGQDHHLKAPHVCNLSKDPVLKSGMPWPGGMHGCEFQAERAADAAAVGAAEGHGSLSVLPGHARQPAVQRTPRGRLLHGLHPCLPGSALPHAAPRTLGAPLVAVLCIRALLDLQFKVKELEFRVNPSSQI